MNILALFIFTCATVPSNWCAPIVEDPDALDEETLNGVHGHGVLDDKPSDGEHGHADPYRGGRDFNNNDFDVGDIVVSGHVKGDDVSIGSSIDIQVGESISEPLLTSSISDPLPTGANLDPLPTGANLDPLPTGANLDPLPSGPNLESLPTVAVWESHNVGILEPLPSLPEQDGIPNEMQSSPGSCDQDACNIGVSVGAGVCSVAAGVGGAAVAATTCAATAWFTFGLSCAVAGIVYTAAGAACGVAGELGSQACDACAEVDFKDIAESIESIGESIESNHLEQMEWFEKLDKNDKEIVKNQGKMIELQQMGIGKMDHLINKNKEIKNKIDQTQMLTLYGQDIKKIGNVFAKFQFLNRGPSGIIEHDYRSETFIRAALDDIDGLESLINNIFLMLIGGHDMKSESIYEVLKDSYCSAEVHEYFLSTQMEALMMMTTALAMKGHPLSIMSHYNNIFNQHVVKATSVFVQNCGCPSGFARSNRGKLSTLLDELPQSTVKLEENRRKIMKIDDKAMRLKMNLIFEIKNFEPNQIAMSRLKKHTVEDIELVVDIMKNQIKTETQIHDYADVCVDEKLNIEKTCAAFTPDSILTTLVTSCAPPPTLSNGKFLCMNDSFCYAVCDQGYYLPTNRATEDRFMTPFIMCVGKTWTPLPTTYQCKPGVWYNSNGFWMISPQKSTSCETVCSEVGKKCDPNEIKSATLDPSCSALLKLFPGKTCSVCGPDDATNLYCFPGSPDNKRVYYHKRFTSESYTCETTADGRVLIACPCA